MTSRRHAVSFADLLPGTDTPRIELDRVSPGRFVLRNEFRYLDHEFGTITVRPFETDLTSIRRYDSWITPRLGRHLPATILHDALIDGSAYSIAGQHRPDDHAADRILHDALRALGVGAFRRRTIWSAASLLGTGTRRDLKWVLPWLALVVVSAVWHFLEIVDATDLHPVLGDWQPWLEWPVAALVTFLVGALAALPLAAVRPVYLGPAVMQAFVVAIAFVPVLAMVPGFVVMWLATLMMRLFKL